VNGFVPGAAFSTNFKLMDLETCAGGIEDLGASPRYRCGLVRAPVRDHINGYIYATIPYE
jgi:hypothetical protein